MQTKRVSEYSLTLFIGQDLQDVIPWSLRVPENISRYAHVDIRLSDYVMFHIPNPTYELFNK